MTRKSVVVCSSPLEGHVSPMLGVALGLIERGYRVRFLTGARFAEAVAGIGAEFLPLPAESDFDPADVVVTSTGGKRLSGPAALRENIKTIFLDPAAGQYRALTAALDAEPADAVLAEMAFVGAAALTAQPRGQRPLVAACGIIALGLSSRDCAPFGIGIPPGSGGLARLRNRALNWAVKNVVLARSQHQAERTLTELTGRGLYGLFFMDWVRRAELIVQFTVPGFEYPRSDAPESLHFLGPVSRLALSNASLPDWWPELDDGLPVVHVSQGTVANLDFSELIMPTMAALSGQELLVVVSTGHRPVSELGALPGNVRAAEFLPYDRLMPKVNVVITNGGYGGLHYALERGVPVVVAGDTEDKPETAARVAWTGVGIDLHTGVPSEAAIRTATLRVLSDDRYRLASQRIGAEISTSPGIDGLAGLLEARA
ncbi:nucleotide disphospho-sugar-binding domain-containing protein [Arthrobacter sp. LAPM80]|uniref:glycosyltransferase n=1 Tax=Arthrobacter sp. LAPM80 TaxID=3141788 RepID=UPI00398A69B4